MRRRSLLQTAAGTAAWLAAGPALAEYLGAPRTFLWNPEFNALADTSAFKKDPPWRVGFANAAVNDLWLVTFVHGVEARVAANRDKFEAFLITDANGDPTKQIADIQDLVNQDLDLLLVNPATADALDPILGRVMRQGIPVVNVTRRVKSDENFVTFVTASDHSLARLSATWLVEYLKGQGKIVVLPGLAGASPAELRLQAAREIFAQHPGIRILDTQYTGWSPANGKSIMSALIQRFGKEIQGVWADSGLQGSGSVEAFLAAGYQDGQIPPHTGGDLNGMYQLAVTHKFPFCGIDYTPSIGIKAVDVLMDVLSGVPVPKRVYVNFQVVVSEGDETPSIKADVPLKEYARMDKPAGLIMGHGLGPDYDPNTFKVELPRG